ncbi:MAG: hypothetical protein WC994_06510 [Brumimicrobium sp.]
MKNTIFIILIFVGLCSPVLAQRKTKLNTHGNGTLYLQFGYNRSGYLPTDVDVKSSAYNYTLQKVELSDNLEEKKMGAYFSSSSPQFSAKIGYFVANHWSITGSWDRYNTFFKLGQETQLSGVFAPGNHAAFSGETNQTILGNTNDFRISQRYGMNVFSLGVQRNDMLGRTKGAEFAIHTLYGLRFGLIHTKADYTYNGSTTKDLTSVSGLAVMLDLGVRFDFYQYVFLQVGLNSGVLHQNNIKLSQNGETIGKQSALFLSPTLSVGFSIFANPKNNCASCPTW